MTSGPNPPSPPHMPRETRRGVRVRRRIAQVVAVIAFFVAIVPLFRLGFVDINDNPGLVRTGLISAGVFIVALLYANARHTTLGHQSDGDEPARSPRPDGDEPTRGTREVVDDFLARLGEGDAPGVAALFAPQFGWALNWPDGPAADAVPWVRHRPDRAAVEQHFRAIADGNRPASEPTTIDTILVDGQHAVVLGTLRNTVVATGRSYQARFALHLTVTEGAITAYHVYEDSLAVALAAGAVTTT